MIESKKKKCYTIFMYNFFEHYSELSLPPAVGEEDIYFVGGSVRNILSKKPLPKDIDICGNIDMAKIHTDIGIPHQYIKKLHSIRFSCDGKDIDITAFRREEYSRGYFPSKVERVETILEDSLRRDFTINAIYISKSGEVFDFHNGQNHWEEKKLQAISKDTMKVDGLRIYRMIRFSLTLGLEIERETLQSAEQNKCNILAISKERGKREFDKFSDKINGNNIEIIERLGIFKHLELDPKKIIKT